MGVLDTISGVFGRAETPELDKTKEALNQLKEKVEQQTNIDSAMAPLKTAFQNDFVMELGLSDQTELAGYWNQIDTFAKEEILKNTPEAKKIDEFIKKIENLPKLKEAIDSKSPFSAVTGLFKGITENPKLKWLTGLIGGYFGTMAMKEAAKAKKEGIEEEYAWLANLYKKIAGFFGWKPKEKPADTTKKQLQQTTQQTAEIQTETLSEQEQKEFNEIKTKIETVFANQNITLDTNAKNFKEDLKYWGENNKQGNDLSALVETALKPDGSLGKITKAFKEKYATEPLTLRLLDLKFQQEKTPNEIEKITKLIKADTTSEFEIKNATPEKIRAFLQEVRDKKFEDVMKKTDTYQKKSSAST